MARTALVLRVLKAAAGRVTSFDVARPPAVAAPAVSAAASVKAVVVIPTGPADAIKGGVKTS